MQTVFLSTVSRQGLLGRPRWLSQPRKRRITRSLRQTAAYVRVQDHGDTHTHVLRTIWCVQRAGRRSERGVLRFRTWRGLSHLGLTGLGGRVTTGQAAGGSPRPGFRSGMENRARLARITTRLTSWGLQPGREPAAARLPLTLAAAATFIRARADHYAARSHSQAATRDCGCWGGGGGGRVKGLSHRWMLVMDLGTLSPVAQLTCAA